MSKPATNEFLLAAMRVGRIRIKLLLSEMDEIGVALKDNLIDHDNAVLWLDDCGLLQFIDVEIKEQKAA